MTLNASTSRIAAVALAASVATTGGLALAPTAAFAVPEGGYGDLVEQVSPSVVFMPHYNDTNAAHRRAYDRLRQDADR